MNCPFPYSNSDFSVLRVMSTEVSKSGTFSKSS